MSEFDLRPEIFERIRVLENDIDSLGWGQDAGDPSLAYAKKCVQALERMVADDHSIFSVEPWHPLKHMDGHAPSELLLRLLDENGQDLPPYDFVMACYRKTLTARLDIILALAGLHEYINRFRNFADKSISVNISARFLEPRNRNNIQMILDIIKDLDLNGGFIFEIHESASNTDISPAIMQMFYDHGVRFAIDDVTLNVGDIFRISGFREYIDFVKLDRSFVQSYDTDAEMFRNMVEFIRNNAPDTQIVAEGVKDAAHAYQLYQAHQDITYVQGRDLPDRAAFGSDWANQTSK